MHSLAVAHTARQLAIAHHLDPVKAEAAGLLHDCAKCLPLSAMQQLCRDHQLTVDPDILQSGALLHSVAGACQMFTASLTRSFSLPSPTTPAAAPA